MVSVGATRAAMAAMYSHRKTALGALGAGQADQSDGPGERLQVKSGGAGARANSIVLKESLFSPPGASDLWGRDSGEHSILDDRGAP
jgi:hypothetical protein